MTGSIVIRRSEEKSVRFIVGFRAVFNFQLSTMQLNHISPNDYLTLHQQTKDNIHLLNIHCTLKFAIDGCFDGSTVNVYELVDSHDKLYAITLEFLNGARYI